MTVGADARDNGTMPDLAERREQIAVGLAGVRARIDRALEAAGRDDGIDLVVVTKTFPATDVVILAELGVTDVAENRDQEARNKRAQVPGARELRWHMIGQVQRKKASTVAGWADVVESVDRPELVAALGRGALAADRVVDVLVQVCLDIPMLPGRGGVAPQDVLDLAAAVAADPGLTLRGVMAVAPYPGDPDEAFGRLEGIAASVRKRWPTADRISAGMSGDLEQAVAHGATQVRVGGAILGHRVPVQ